MTEAYVDDDVWWHLPAKHGCDILSVPAFNDQPRDEDLPDHRSLLALRGTRGFA